MTQRYQSVLIHEAVVRDGWSWCVLKLGGGPDPVAEGFADTEDEAAEAAESVHRLMEMNR